MKTTTTSISTSNNWLFFLLTVFLILCCHLALAQGQIGVDIDGESAGDWSGISVSMPDAYTIAIGASGNSDNGIGAGHVRVYKKVANSWLQKGVDIDGESNYDASGWSVSMPDSNTIAIGSYLNQGNGDVRVFSWNGIAWIQKGNNIEG